jgi:hypothetical protein
MNNIPSLFFEDEFDRQRSKCGKGAVPRPCITSDRALSRCESPWVPMILVMILPWLLSSSRRCTRRTVSVGGLDLIGSIFSVGCMNRGNEGKKGGSSIPSIFLLIFRPGVDDASIASGDTFAWLPIWCRLVSDWNFGMKCKLKILFCTHTIYMCSKSC